MDKTAVALDLYDYGQQSTDITYFRTPGWAAYAWMMETKQVFEGARRRRISNISVELKELLIEKKVYKAKDYIEQEQQSAQASEAQHIFLDQEKNPRKYRVGDWYYRKHILDLWLDHAHMLLVASAIDDIGF